MLSRAYFIRNDNVCHNWLEGLAGKCIAQRIVSHETTFCPAGKSRLIPLVRHPSERKWRTWTAYTGLYLQIHYMSAWWGQRTLIIWPMTGSGNAIFMWHKIYFFHKKSYLLHQHQTATNWHKIGIEGLNCGIIEAFDNDFPTVLYFWILPEIYKKYMKMFCCFHNYENEQKKK